jgi:hypothetical protein
MSHGPIVTIDINEVLQSEPVKIGSKLSLFIWVCIGLGVLTFGLGIIYDNPQHLWASYFVNLLFFMGLACGQVVLTAIFQIVRAKWSAPLSRVAESAVSFLPWAFILWAATYFGKEHLYPWATAPAAGKEWWMQPNFVYARFFVLLGILFLVMNKFVRMSLRGDIGMLREKATNKSLWSGLHFDSLVKGWKGTHEEVYSIQPNRSRLAPVIIMLYIVIYSLFVFEMYMSMDKIWYANMFGAFNFVGNIYMGWAVLAITVTYLCYTNKNYNKCVNVDQFWDLGKMTFAFCMLWGYTFWSTFLPQWYGNLPEETQWLILRTREFPWKGLAWFIFPACFIIPFITILSRDLKKTPYLYIRICFLILVGTWFEKYLIVMPQFSPKEIPFSCVEVGLFLGFLGAYLLSVKTFLEKYPYVQVSHPATRGSVKW